MLKVKRALISVSDKQGLEDLVKCLSELGVEILSTGGTAKKIRELGIAVKDVSEYTGFPEMLEGRVKTLHPKIHAGLLALRDNSNHLEEIKKHNIKLIDMVVVNLYPFEKVVQQKGVSLEEAVENIDIGGPTMLRSAAKNYKAVAVVTSPSQYPLITKELKDNKGCLSEETLKDLALEVFRRTSEYDTAIFNYLSAEFKEEKLFPQRLTLSLEKVRDLRYGENPHQKASFYRDLSFPGGFSSIKQYQGKELSFNNILDLNSAVEIVKEFIEPACAIIKHNNPCGVASAENVAGAYLDALDCDRLSAFGSIVGFNREVDKNTAEVIMKEADFVECIIAPSYEKSSLEIFSQKKNLRIIEADFDSFRDYLDFRRVGGGFLVQDKDLENIEESNLKVVTKKSPIPGEFTSLLFAYKVVKHVKSNAIVLAKGKKTVGIGAGQMSRVDSVIISVRKAGERAKDSVLASDAFFPKPDAIEEAHRAGIKAIIQPGGSIRDKEVISACDRYGISMVFTGIRHFKH
ncbi:MAG: bifunctional phosphoribosylaminoimidazolecarboxamide formyltransferase/inosine monophosphate cyclohydrolase [Candidatus Omnitrophota bacterium]|nr:MAG: bifunctional phosphoribosylaminoimidazolecarboxamide formyltransferase/inosine monophosphate cyclohydrolase [Candidatus Omnitrophota bacterium]RKY43731.1 MAG: bifunctional phosphoribosylaminoimidazolecarboxamide formyltransferase/inosine monophosphate cyclohydrolase [Candidatus Omnitrophota bacterium]